VTFAPPTIRALAAYWVAQGGVNLGIVGDTAHQAQGTSYHLGKSQLAVGAYSARTARDKAGLTEAASALDLGRLGGSLLALRTFSLWFAKQCQANAPGTRDVREVIFALDGTHVVGWSREAGVNSAFISNYGDSSHLTHTHISFYRDSEFRAKVGLFQPYFKTAPVPATEAPMPALTTYIPGSVATIKATANIRTAPTLAAATVARVSTGEKAKVIGTVKGAIDPDGGSDQWFMWWELSHYLYTAKSNVTSVAAATTDCAPAVAAAVTAQKAADAQAQTAAVNAATAPLKQKIAAAKSALG